MCRLLQQLRGFPREQPVRRLELLAALYQRFRAAGGLR